MSVCAGVTINRRRNGSIHKEQLDSGQGAFLGREVQRRHVALVTCPDLCSRIKQQTHGLAVTTPAA